MKKTNEEIKKLENDKTAAQQRVNLAKEEEQRRANNLATMKKENESLKEKLANLQKIANVTNEATTSNKTNKTSGKYTASWTIHAYNNYNGRVQSVYRETNLSDIEKNKLRNWAMQPIVGRYTDKDDKDFIATNGLIPNHPIAETNSNERNTAKWKPIGDTDDYLFAKAISLITGKPYTVSQTRSALNIQLHDTEFYSPMESVLREGVIIDKPKMLPPLEKE